MVEVFREVRRVLRDDGTLWLNIGDSYAGSWGARGRGDGTNAARPDLEAKHGTIAPARNGFPGIKPKDRMMMPARVALGLQADGWWLRDEIIWHKPNPMPMSVQDRTTPAHEMLYLFSKARRYAYDAAAIAEQAVSDHASGNGFAGRQGGAEHMPMSGGKGTTEQWLPGGTRNRRSVWTVPVEPFSEAHFATYPPALIEPCILAGCPKSGTVLDPFGGAGTTGLVADRLQRDAVLIEINPEYAEIARRRIASEAGMFGEVLAA
jgi:DNA modification methylase